MFKCVCIGLNINSHVGIVCNIYVHVFIDVAMCLVVSCYVQCVCVLL